MKQPLRHQVLIPSLAVALASLVAAGALNAWLASRNAREQMTARIQGVVDVLNAANFPLTGAVLRQMRDLSSGEFVLVDGRGALVASSFDDPPGLSVDAPGVDARGALTSPVVEIGGRWYFHARVPLRRAAGGPARSLHILFPHAEYQRRWREAFVPPVAVGVVAAAAVAVVANRVARRISRTTSKLGDDVQRLAHGDFNPVPLPDIDDELRQLARSINRTAEMLAEYERQVRRTEQVRTIAMLGAGLAHELRNAATGCRLAIELHAEQCDPAGTDESLTVARRQLRLMEAQLQRFLRVGKSPPTATRTTVDAAEVVTELTALVQPAARHADVRLEWAPPDGPALVVADREALGQAVLNLILNALEAARADSTANNARRVRIELNADGQWVQLIVSDTGAGPRGELAETLFDPFVTSKPEGAGLGLAVARDVVVALGGNLTWRRDAGTTHFLVSLPQLKGDAVVELSGCR